MLKKLFYDIFYHNSEPSFLDTFKSNLLYALVSTTSYLCSVFIDNNVVINLKLIYFCFPISNTIVWCNKQTLTFIRVKVLQNYCDSLHSHQKSSSRLLLLVFHWDF